MPSCTSKPQATPEAQPAQQNAPVDLLKNPVKSTILVTEKKLRNLEKRRVRTFNALSRQPFFRCLEFFLDS